MGVRFVPSVTVGVPVCVCVCACVLRMAGQAQLVVFDAQGNLRVLDPEKYGEMEALMKDCDGFTESACAPSPLCVFRTRMTRLLRVSDCACVYVWVLFVCLHVCKHTHVCVYIHGRMCMCVSVCVVMLVNVLNE
mgnify:CR=1 FL=1